MKRTGHTFEGAGAIQSSLFKSSIHLLLLTLLSVAPALADNDALLQGMASYRAGNYTEAVEHLQAALSTDFNNAKLHYFLANSYIKLNRREAGVREYRIAFALEPEREVGKMSHQALVNMGLESDKEKETPVAEPEKKTPTDPVLDKVTASLREQAEKARSQSRQDADASNNEMSKRFADQLDRNKQQMLQDLSYYRRGRLIQPPLPPEAIKQLDTLKQAYDQQRSGQQDNLYKRSDEYQKSADNLSNLLNSKTGNGPQLVPQGTNLYIRNYKNDTAGKSTTSSAGTPASSPTTPPQSTR